MPYYYTVKKNKETFTVLYKLKQTYMIWNKQIKSSSTVIITQKAGLEWSIVLPPGHFNL